MKRETAYKEYIETNSPEETFEAGRKLGMTLNWVKDLAAR